MNGTKTNNPNKLSDIMQLIGQQKLPPVHKWEPESCGEIDIRIARDGAWFYNGTPIGRKEMVKLFSTVLRHEADDKYYLVTPVEKLEIRVDDAPFVAVEVVREGKAAGQTLSFRTNVGDWVIAGQDNPIRVETDKQTKEPSPYILVRDRLEALINRPVFYELVELGEKQGNSGKETLGVWSQGAFFEIGRL